jgi:putative aminopeptidase FrvX
MALPSINTSYLLDILSALLNIPSPTGYTEQALAYIQEIMDDFPELQLSKTRKGALVVQWSGEQDNAPRALTAHVDTLGAMVKEIKPNGRLKMTKLGGFAWNTVEGEGCTVYTATGQQIRGSILLTKASGHVYGNQVNDLKRDDDLMEIRLDAKTSTADETVKLGIGVGDFVAFDPRVEFNNNFIRSRHLDDKACVACLISAVQTLFQAGLQPTQKTYLLFSNYEEVGHGAATGIPPEVCELIAVDMAAVGEGQNSDEYHATLCLKDSGGPYHYELCQHMRQLAEKYDISYKVDIYPYYGSDGEAYWRAGGNVALALIGPGVDASHNYERTNLDALIATTQWIMAYLLN